MNRSIRPKRGVFVLYLLPGLIWYTLIVFAPICLALYYGFFDWSGGSKMVFVGLQNFIELTRDSTFIKSFFNNVKLTLMCIIGQIGIAFILAIFLNSRGVRFKGFHRTMSYFPAVLSAVVVGFIWTMIYDYNYGLINLFLKFAGAKALTQPWLNNEKLALILVAIPLIWQYVGYYLIIILSSLSAIDPQIFEMAEIDGADGFERAMHITLPLIKNTLIVCITLCIAGNMKVFDHIYVMTGGGPGTASSVMAMYSYKTSFLSYKMGYGSAMSIGILVLSLLFIGGSRAILMKLTRDRGE